MPYKKRIWLPECYYHVTSRGNRKEVLFQSKSDYQVFLEILAKVYEQYHFELASYCLMSNHYHLQIRSPHVPLSKIMSLVNKRYANYYNAKYSFTGHVFEQRFNAKVILGLGGMLLVSWYIHLNPVAAQIVPTPAHYPWSSYRFYQQNNPATTLPDYLNINTILQRFDGTTEQKKAQYCVSVERSRFYSKKSQ
ncbi:transposase [Mesobacillus maritimus]|uniref:transposase n=1 Tax=Mesobacillus maritimus TaxID=1643336 RepID=UPI00203E6E6B|nr:transposase [Mesobacillus maritimus]MCM3668280.1 transposase [Mesobacillus maritimus]